MSGIGEALLISAVASLVTAGVTYALTPTQKVQGNRLNDLSSATSSYGSPLPWAWGTVRLPGNKIWIDYLEEAKRTEKQGKVKTTFFDYYGYYASMFCDCPFRPIVDYNRLWFNKKLVYSRVGGAETIAEGGKFAEQYLRFYKGEPAQEIDPLLANVDPISSYSYGLPTDPASRDAFLRASGIDPNTAVLTPAYNYRAYMVAQRIPLADFFNSLPQDEAEIIASENCTLGQIVGDIFSLYYESDRYDVSLLTTPVKGYAVDTVEAAKSAVQTLQQAYFFDIVDSNGVYKFIPLNHPRDVVHLSSEDLAAHTGTQTPPKFEIIEADPSTLPSQVIVKYIDPDLNYDVNEQRSQLEVKSHYNPNPVTLSFNLVLSASDAATIADRALILAWIQKYTYKFQLPPTYLILEPTDLVPNLFDDRDYPIKLTQTRLGANLIVECEGTAHDIFFWNLVRTLEEGGITLGVADYNVTIVTSGRTLAVADAAGNTYREGVDYTTNNEGIQIIQSGSIPQGTELIVTTTSTPTVPADTTGEIKSAGDTELVVLDIPLIENSDEDYTIYFTAGGGDNWDGSSIYFSTDNSRYTFATALRDKGVYGECLTVLGSDQTSTVSVLLNISEVESITDSDLALGLNFALVGDEIIQFKNAELSGINEYTLSGLTRGLRGTEAFVDSHQIGDRFILLTGESATIAQYQMQFADLNSVGQLLSGNLPTQNVTVRYFKAVSSGQTLAEVEPVQITYRGVSMRPYAPVNLAATKNGVGDITITWDRRDRHSDIENPPILSEDEERYIINQLADRTTIRTQQTNNNSSIYTVVEQTSDFGSVASTITVKIAQVSSEFGNGSFATATLTPELVEPAPTITSFTPASALVGATITVTGTDLASVTEVKIGDIVQNNLAVVDNQTAEFTIAPGTVSGDIEITTTGGTASSNNALIIETLQTLEGHVIQDDTDALTQRPNLKFTGNVAVTDDETESATIVEILAPTVSVAATPGTFDETSIITQILNDGDMTAIDLELAAVTAIRQIDVSQPARIRLFGTDAARTADTADINTQLQDVSSLILDKLITDSYQFGRGILANNCDDPITNYIYARIGNNSGTSNSIDVEIKYYAIASALSNDEGDAGNNGQTDFNLTDLPRLQLWLDATDSSTIITSGSTVTTWTDKSSKNNDVQVALGSPQLEGEEIVFDRNSVFSYTTPSFPGASPRYIACSIKSFYAPIGQYFWSNGTFGNNQFFSLATTGQTNGLTITSTGPGSAASTATFKFGTWHIMEVSYDGSVAKVYLDNALIIESNMPINTNAAEASRIGSLAHYRDRGLLGSMREFIVCDRALTEQERTDVYNAMLAKLPTS